MSINLRLLAWAGAVSALAALGHVAACTTTDTDTPDGGGGLGSGNPNAGSANGGAAGNSSGNAGSSMVGTVCESPLVLDGTNPGIATFDTYDGTDITKWYAPLGGDASTTVLVGPFGYGDRVVGAKTDAVETFDMVGGYSSTYAMRVADSMAQNYGGGLGIWISQCLNATVFSGISFWVRGNAPAGTATLSLRMVETVSSTPDADGKYGTCPGDSTTCVNPQYSFPVTDTWTEIKAPWSSFKLGDAAGTSVKPDGRNIVQIQWDIGLQWVDNDAGTGTYVPVPAAYELVVDTVAFY